MARTRWRTLIPGLLLTLGAAGCASTGVDEGQVQEALDAAIGEGSYDLDAATDYATRLCSAAEAGEELPSVGDVVEDPAQAADAALAAAEAACPDARAQVEQQIDEVTGG